MPTNPEFFSIFSVKILADLHEAFPLGFQLSPSKYTDQHADQKLKSDLAKARAKAAGVTIAQAHAGKIGEQDAFVDAIVKEFNDLERTHALESEHLAAIFVGTIGFLLAEEYIRRLPNDDRSEVFQLTAKGFSHLHKEFVDGSITDQKKRSVISQMKAAVGDTNTLAGSLALELATKVFGG